jgi:hypothetical protein
LFSWLENATVFESSWLWTISLWIASLIACILEYDTHACTGDVIKGCNVLSASYTVCMSVPRFCWRYKYSANESEQYELYGVRSS